MAMHKLLVIFALALAFAATAAAATGRLAVVSTNGFAVRGTAFHPGEHVVVHVSAVGMTGSRRLTVGAGGSFVARFRAIVVPHCAAYTVSATGDKGSRAGLRVMPECPNGPTP
jgi:hypothetical protein